MIDLHAPRYKRVGECSRCGDCCQGEDCEHLDVTHGVATCAIHGDKRPDKCVLHPANPPIMFERCTYRFWDTWEGRYIKAREL